MRCVQPLRFSALALALAMAAVSPARADNDRDGGGERGERCERRNCALVAPQPDLGTGILGSLVLIAGLLAARRYR